MANRMKSAIVSIATPSLAGALVSVLVGWVVIHAANIESDAAELVIPIGIVVAAVVGSTLWLSRRPSVERDTTPVILLSTVITLLLWATPGRQVTRLLLVPLPIAHAGFMAFFLAAVVVSLVVTAIYLAVLTIRGRRADGIEWLWMIRDNSRKLSPSRMANGFMIGNGAFVLVAAIMVRFLFLWIAGTTRARISSYDATMDWVADVERFVVLTTIAGSCIAWFVKRGLRLSLAVRILIVADLATIAANSRFYRVLW